VGTVDTVPCRVVVDHEGLTAALLLDSRLPASAFSSEEILHIVNEAGIAVTPAVKSKVDEIMSSIRGGQVPTDSIVIAKGKPANPGCDGRFELAPELQTHGSEDGDSINYYEQRRILTVSAGQVIGRIFPPEQPTAGEDVYGRPIKPDVRRHPMQLGKNVRIADDGMSVIAEADGQVKNDASGVSILDVVSVNGNVDFNSGNVDATSDVVIRGNVLDLFSVKSRKSIEIGGNVEAAELSAAENIFVRGGICGKDKGKVTSGGEIRAKFCSGVELNAAGDIHIAREAINCTISTRGSLQIPNGSLIGGRSHARNGARVSVLGSEAGIKTHIGVGMDPGVYASIAAIDTKIKSIRKTADEIRTHVKPLLANLKRLTPDQRERATELMFKADDLEAQTEPLESEKQKLLEEATPVEGASLLVGSRLHAGTLVTVDNLELRFDKELKGPIKIEKRKIDNVTEVVGVNQLSGSVITFPARKIEPPDVSLPKAHTTSVA